MTKIRPRLVALVLRKELGEAIRDKNLVLQLVILPLFMYPLMGFGAYQVFSVVRGMEEKVVLPVWVDGDLPAALRERIEDVDRIQLLPTPPELDAADAAPDATVYRELRDASQDPPLVLLSYWSRAGTDSLRLYYESSSDRSSEMREALSTRIEAHRDSLVRVRAAEVGMSSVEVDLFDEERVNTASARQMGALILSMALPIFLMFMLGQGAYYAALDTVVGERERGTLETLFTSPLSKSEIFLGKFLYVVCSAMLTFVLNLASLLFFARYVLELMPLPFELSVQLPPLTVLAIVLAALLAAAGLAAVMMLSVVPAKHYREGQSALTPSYMLAGFSSFAVMGTTQTYGLKFALIPFVNVAALTKTAIGGELDLTFALTTYGSLALLSTVAVLIAARMASRESALFDPDLSLKQLFREAFRS